MNKFPPDFEKYARQYRIWGRMTLHHKRIKRAKQIIKDALSTKNNWYIALSGGKDSTVMTHLITEINPGLPIHNYEDDIQYPGTHEYLEKLASLFGWRIQYHRPPTSNLEKIKQEKINICEPIRRNRKISFDDIYWQHIENMERQYTGCFLGLRKQESRARLMNYAQRDALYRKKNGITICCPLATWDGRDIFAYFLSRDIPIFYIYLNCKFRSPERIRQTWYIPGKFARKGELVQLRYYYPDLYQKLYEMCPEVSNYV